MIASTQFSEVDFTTAPNNEQFRTEKKFREFSQHPLRSVSIKRKRTSVPVFAA